MTNQFEGLKAIVQYRGKRGDGTKWHNMAAFDSRGVAERYAESCAGESPERPWEYRVIDVDGACSA